VFVECLKGISTVINRKSISEEVCFVSLAAAYEAADKFWNSHHPTIITSSSVENKFVFPATEQRTLQNSCST